MLRLVFPCSFESLRVLELSELGLSAFYSTFKIRFILLFTINCDNFNRLLFGYYLVLRRLN